MSSPSMANPLPAIPPALFFLVPLFAVVILLLALSHRPAHYGANQPTQKRRALVSYLAIASLTVLSTLTGALGLTASYPSPNPRTPAELGKAKAESVVQAFLFLELGVSVLYLSSGYVLLSTILKAYTTILVISLSSATLLALLLPFVSTSFPAYLPPVLYLSYAILTIPLVVHTFRQFVRGTSNLDSESSIPLSLSLAPPLPSPTASSASFPSVVSHHEKLPSISSSTSTLAAVDHWQSSAHVHLHPTVPFPAPDDLENGQVVHPTGDDQNLSSRIGRSRSRSLLVFLLAAQGAALMGLCFDIAATVLMTASTRPGSATYGRSIYAILQIVEAAFIVLCITGVMSAYLLHAYNAYLPILTLTQPPDTLVATRDSLVASQAINGLSPPRPHLTVLSPPPVRSSPKFKAKSTILGGTGKARTCFHMRGASASSSFSSPRPQRVPLTPPQDLIICGPSESQLPSPCSPDVVLATQDPTPASFSTPSASLPIPIPTRLPSPDPMPYPTPSTTPTFSKPVPFLGTSRQSVAGGVTFLPDIDAHERARAHAYARRGSSSPCPSLGTMRKRVSSQSQVVDKEWERSSVPKRKKSQHSSKMRQQLDQPLGLGLGLGLKGKTKYPLTIHVSSHGRGSFRFPGGVASPRAKVSDVELRAGEDCEGEREEEGESGDFMDLRDPFACPSPGVNVLSTEEKEGIERAVSWYGRGRGQQGQRLSAWGRLPSLPSIPASPSMTSLASSKGTGRVSKNPKGRVGRKARHGKEGAKFGGGEDVDFDVEEALLAQRLLRRLDSGSVEHDAGG